MTRVLWTPPRIPGRTTRSASFQRYLLINSFFTKFSWIYLSVFLSIFFLRVQNTIGLQIYFFFVLFFYQKCCPPQVLNLVLRLYPKVKYKSTGNSCYFAFARTHKFCMDMCLLCCKGFLSVSRPVFSIAKRLVFAISTILQYHWLHRIHSLVHE